MPTFFQAEDYSLYLGCLSEECMRYGVLVWGYCLMTNHIHLIAIPESEYSLRWAVGETHRRYSTAINAREHWTGYLWQGRFSSFPMEETHLSRALRYVERNPVRAGIASLPWEYLWSSARAHALGVPDPLLSPIPSALSPSEWQVFLGFDDEDTDLVAFRSHCSTGRPFGSATFLSHLEEQTGRILQPQKRGPKGRRDEFE